jgi:NADH-quinone oxidoreductase subunit M
MIPVLLIFIPVVAGLLVFFAKQYAKPIAQIATIAILGTMLYALTLPANSNLLSYKADWLYSLGASFHVGLDGIGKLLCLLTAIAFPIIFLTIEEDEIKSQYNYYALLLLTMAGLMGVFVAMDGLLFYFFWELALIPVYFLCSIWGGERRIPATFKFFVYTFLGSLFMLIGLIYLSTKAGGFNMKELYAAAASSANQGWLFLLFFLAFAIKMPIFPFHTWQPDAYQQSPTSTTMVLSAVMVKMGLFGLVRWLIPMFPEVSTYAAKAIIVFAVIGIVYASLLATRQQNVKRLVAYSSIAHIGLMCAALFTNDAVGIQGAMMQMFHHGINILGLWIVIHIIEHRTGIQNISELGGLAKISPTLAIFLVIIALANIALPLTNAFTGEFLMLNALYKYNVWTAVFAGLGVILSAVYTLNMIQKVFYGAPNAATQNFGDISANQKVALAMLVVFILVMGVYSKPFNSWLADSVNSVLVK